MKYVFDSLTYTGFLYFFKFFIDIFVDVVDFNQIFAQVCQVH